MNDDFDFELDLEHRKVGDVVDAQGVLVALGDDDLVGGVIVLTKIIDSDGDVRLSIANSDGLSWLERRGMLSAALAGEDG